ncbi:MAG: hypothetical protein JST42_05445 [Bacteroidetes bacterium]|nr:hypothetical protein [Bacteroidota bacterium]
MMPKKALGVLLLSLFIVAGRLHGQTASFNFSLNPVTVPGWTNVYGSPGSAVCSGTSNGITVSSVAPGNWAVYNGDNSTSFNGGGADNGTFFPAAVMANDWYQYSAYYAQYNALLPQLVLTGLNKDSVYTIKMTGSNKLYPDVFNVNPIRYTVAGAIIYGFSDVNGTNNTSDGAVFHNVAPDASGAVKIYVNTYNGSNLAIICGIQIITGHSTAPQPVVAFTRPSNNQLLPEDGVISLAATATETGGTIARVEFYANDVLLASDSAAPYTFAWANADPGSYVLKARVVDGFGNTTVATINATVQSLNYFWSTTGNIATGADSSFVGTVDTNDLAFRTNNIERMRIKKDGTMTIPGTGSDKINQPAMRVYPNGDLTLGSTMDSGADTYLQNGMRFYSKLGLLQIGTTDKLDTAVNKYVYNNYKGTGILINSDEPNIIKGRIYSSYVSGDLHNLDSTAILTWSILTGESIHVSGWTDHSILAGYGHFVKGSSDCLITGSSNQITKPMLVSLINGFVNSTADSAAGSLVSGAYNQFGGNSQLLAGQYLINRTPFGASLGNSNVDFSTLPYTGQRGSAAAGLDRYPLLVLGNGNTDGVVRSNAMTVLYNGRTQINTTGFGQTLTQTAVTPKAALDVVSTNTGVLLPRLTNAQRGAIASGDLQNGLLLYNTDSSVFQYYNGSVWNSMGSSISGATSGHWMYSNGLQYDSINSVAIGTSQAPAGYMLAVKGSGLFTRLQVKSIANWPDYVFEKKYQLKTLEDLAAYIERYKHLPDVVSVAKVNAEGVDLGANQAAILKNVEELTLHLIEENRQLKVQSEKAAELEKKVAGQDERFIELQKQIDALKGLINKTIN